MFYFISADIISYNFSDFNSICKIFLLQIFLFKRIHPNSLNSQNLLSMIKRFSQFFPKMSSGNIFCQNLLRKSYKSTSFVSVENWYGRFILKVPTTDSLVFFFFTAIWLPCGQFRVILQGIVSLYFNHFDPKVTESFFSEHIPRTAILTQALVVTCI